MLQKLIFLVTTKEKQVTLSDYNAINIDISFCHKDVHVYIICGIVVTFL